MYGINNNNASEVMNINQEAERKSESDSDEKEFGNDVEDEF
jgi:hypothetical protein